MGFKFDVGNLTKNLAVQDLKTKAALGVYAKTVGLKMENYAKSNARWQDHTGNARNGLKGNSETFGSGARAKISHGVDYGIYLELCNEKRFAILDKTVKAVAPEALRGLGNILK